MSCSSRGRAADDDAQEDPTPQAVATLGWLRPVRTTATAA